MDIGVFIFKNTLYTISILMNYYKCLKILTKSPQMEKIVFPWKDQNIKGYAVQGRKMTRVLEPETVS